MFFGTRMDWSHLVWWHFITIVQHVFLLKDHGWFMYFPLMGKQVHTKPGCEIKETIYCFDGKKYPCSCSFQLL